jgi:enamine deaminase RidA (YjgF/YER057c/UK114 family)
VTVEQARDAARLCGLNHLGMMKAALGDLDRVERIVRLIGYVNSAPGFTEQPSVINGESDLYIALWGEKGRHARAALGISGMWANAPVETEVIVQVKPERPRAATVVRAAGRQRVRAAIRPAVASRTGRGQAAARRRRA